MASVALGNWIGARKSALAEIAAAHGALGGTGPGRRRATLQINHAYAVLLSSQFQGFCRDLHTERVVMMQGRKLDHGNPNAGNLGSDFARLGMSFWTEVGRVDGRKTQRSAVVQDLSDWRNAIAHQDWSGVPNQNPTLHLRQSTLGCGVRVPGLAVSFDSAVGQHLAAMVGPLSEVAEPIEVEVPESDLSVAA